MQAPPRRRRDPLVILVAGVLLVVAATVGLWVGGGRGPTAVDATRGPVTLTWWHLGAGEPMSGFWAQVAAEFERQRPYVTIEMSAYEMLPARAADGDADLFPTYAGAPELADGFRAGTVMDITESVGAELAAVGGLAAGWSVDGRQLGLPYRMGIEGFWYRRSLFAQAGITAPPTTLAGLDDAVAKLKTAGIIPIVVGLENRWPAAHYWHNFALRACPAGVLQRSAVELTFTDPCFVRAGEALAAFVATEPFQPEAAYSPAWENGNPSALFAGGQAAMELMGDWYPGVVAGLVQDPDALLADLGWFPFPLVPGGQGDPGAALGGGDGFACSAQAPPECVELLRYIASEPVQTRFAELGVGLPAIRGAAAGVVGPYPAELLAAQYDAGYVQPWLDLAYGYQVGSAMNDAIAEMFRGLRSAQGIVDAINDAAEQAR